MNSDKKRNYDYLIYDANGTRKVINGVEYPATEDDLPKKHQDSGCTECKFVEDLNTLLLYVVPRELREKATKMPSFVGKFHMPDWVGHSSFYLFLCSECDRVGVDYPHGYRGEFVYLRCNNCYAEIILVSRKDYERDDIFIPWALLSFRERWRKAKNMAEQLENLKPLNQDVSNDNEKLKG